MKNQPSSSAYDVIIIGAGIGGLTAGALLAKEGKKVLVVEQEKDPGGFARDFQFGPYIINPALHAIMGCNSSGPYGPGVIHTVLNHLGVQDQCEFVPFNPFYCAQFPDFQMDVPTGREAYLDAHLRHFPDEAEGLRELVDLCSALYREFLSFPVAWRLQDWVLMPFRHPKVFRNSNATVERVVNRYLKNPRLKTIYPILYPYLALPPSQLSFPLWGIMMASYIEEGTYYCKGGFNNFSNALASAISNHGGELVLETRVSQIRLDKGRVKSISLENGQEVFAPQIIANNDPRQLFQDLLESGQIPGSYSRKLNKLKPSLSVLGIYLATDLDIHALGISKVTLVSGWDLEVEFEAAGKGDVGMIAIHVPSVVDPSLAPPGEHIVVLQACIHNHALDLSSQMSERFSEGLLNQAEKVIPDLRHHITFKAAFDETPHMEYPLHQLDTIYGWANSTKQAGPRRLPCRTPIQGLYLAGHWTQPGSGIWTVVLSGINAARIVLGKDISRPIWPLYF
jgi:prolycopene isomerase